MAKTLCASTHYMDEAEYCHRIALLYRGRVIALGAPAELRAAHGGEDMDHVFIASIEREEERTR